MKRNLIKNEWDVIGGERCDLLSAPQSEAVYMLVIKSTAFKGRKIVYIGVTDNLRKRLCSHTVLNVLRFNKSTYSIYVYYKNFGRHYNNMKESMLIRDYKPPYNNSFKEKPKYTIWHLWSDLGVSLIKRNKYSGYRHRDIPLETLKPNNV
jgi:predicted GIY-YIG superfamily endonuclease